MKTTSTFVLAAAIAASGWLAAAPQAGPASIAIIDGNRVLESSNVGQQARDQLESAATNWRSRIDTATQELQALTNRRQEQALTLNESALARLNQEIEEKQVEIQRLNDDANRELQRMQQQITVQVNEQLGPLVEQFAAQQGLDLILDSSNMSGLLYFGNATDMTEQFLTMVNAGADTPEQQ